MINGAGSAASSQFSVNDRSMPANQFALNENSSASSAFMVNDRSVGES